MSPAFLTAASSMTCLHGGTVIATPGSAASSAGAPILRVGDACTIAGCGFTLPGGVPSPCLSVQWTAPAARVRHGGDPALIQSSVGLCLAATQAPQGTVQIASTQTRAAGV
jgi:hypothetical protein